MNAAILQALVVRKSYIDYYAECGFSAHFLVLSGILFLWIAFTCILTSADKARSLYPRLLIPCSLLPIIIGIFGSSYGLHGALESMRFHPYNGANSIGSISYHPEELLLPLIAGSFLSAVFIFLSIAIIAFGRFCKINRGIEGVERNADESSQ